MRRGLTLHPVEEAITLALRRGPKPRVEEVGIDEAHGRLAAEEVRAPSDVPPRDRSVLDGYAARWVDISGATPESPAILRLAGHVPVDAGDPGGIGPREAARVDTGSPLPRGADVVVPQEYVDVRGDRIAVLKAFPAGYGVAARGEDLREGEKIVGVGDVINEARLGLLASIGASRVKVYKPFRAVVHPVGDEIIEPWEEMAAGRVYDSTSRLAVFWLRSRGVDARRGGRLGDSEEAVARAL
ncbi:MAG: hypothetical protein LRS49_01830, partial [Desulfurococcales archaeon]|nr:hypothetical protein [Desulfurococcales archaeon]